MLVKIDCYLMNKESEEKELLKWFIINNCIVVGCVVDD